MPDPSEPNLREMLQELRDQLDSADAVDPDLSVPLRTAIVDLQSALETADEDAEPDRHQTVLDHLTRIALRFEASHPKLADAINKVTNELASMGI